MDTLSTYDQLAQNILNSNQPVNIILHEKNNGKEIVLTLAKIFSTEHIIEIIVDPNVLNRFHFSEDARVVCFDSVLSLYKKQFSYWSFHLEKLSFTRHIKNLGYGHFEKITKFDLPSDGKFTFLNEDEAWQAFCLVAKKFYFNFSDDELNDIYTHYERGAFDSLDETAKDLIAIYATAKYTARNFDSTELKVLTHLIMLEQPNFPICPARHWFVVENASSLSRLDLYFLQQLPMKRLVFVLNPMFALNPANPVPDVRDVFPNHEIFKVPDDVNTQRLVKSFYYSDNKKTIKKILSLIQKYSGRYSIGIFIDEERDSLFYTKLKQMLHRKKIYYYPQEEINLWLSFSDLFYSILSSNMRLQDWVYLLSLLKLRKYKVMPLAMLLANRKFTAIKDKNILDFIDKIRKCICFKDGQYNAQDLLAVLLPLIKNKILTELLTRLTLCFIPFQHKQLRYWHNQKVYNELFQDQLILTTSPDFFRTETRDVVFFIGDPKTTKLSDIVVNATIKKLYIFK